MSDQLFSATIDQIAAALTAFTGACGNVPKTDTAELEGTSAKTGRDWKMVYHYVDLAGVRAHVQPHLVTAGLSVTQLFDGGLIVTRLMHASGQWIESRLPLPVAPDPRELGSQITYRRRYAYLAILGLAAEEEDDDGRRASEAAEAERRGHQLARHRDARQQATEGRRRPDPQPRQDQSINPVEARQQAILGAATVDAAATELMSARSALGGDPLVSICEGAYAERVVAALKAATTGDVAALSELCRRVAPRGTAQATVREAFAAARNRLNEASQ